VAAKYVWAVGIDITSTGRWKTLIERWKGTSWSRVTSPNPSGNQQLEAVSASSKTDAWAVGTIAAHWNGTNWSRVTLPKPAGTFLTAVTDISPTNAWAAGFYTASSGNQHPVIEHWN
jgi:hypothetical protein